MAGDKDQSGYVDGRWAMVTLTYRPGMSYQPNDISHLTKCMTAWAERRHFKLAYVWVAELQKRGEVHYHILVKLPWDSKAATWQKMPYPDEQGWWSRKEVPLGSSRVEWVRKTGKGYMAKYASKDTQRLGMFAKGLRLCGSGGLPERARAWVRWLACPSYIRKETSPTDYPMRVDGGYRLADGSYIPSPWQATPMPEFGGVLLERLSLDQWFSKVAENNPVRRFLALEDARARVGNFCEVMWAFGGGRFSNPWEVACKN